MKCPRCGSAETHKSHTRGRIERIVRALFNVRFYRCALCETRYPGFDSSSDSKSPWRTIRNFAVVLATVLMLIYMTAYVQDRRDQARREFSKTPQVKGKK